MSITTNFLAFISLTLVLAFNNFISIINSYHGVPYYSSLRSIVILPSIILLILFFTTLLTKTHLKKNAITISLFFLLLLTMVIVAIKNIPNQLFDFRGVSVVNYNLVVISKYLLYFVIGVSLIQPTKYRRTTIVIFILLTLNILAHSNLLEFRLADGYSDETRAKYLFLADSYALWAFITIGCIKKSSSRYLAILVALLILYIIGSRGGLYAFMLTLMIMYCAYSNKIILLVITIYCFFTVLFLGIFDFELADNRMMRIIVGAEDNSINSRIIYFELGLAAIKENLMFGDFGGQVLEFNIIGKYIHNYLSLWRQYGLVTFVLATILIGFLIKNVYQILRTMSKRKLTTNIYWFVGISLFLLIELITSRSYAYPYIWLCVGFMIPLAKENRLNINNGDRST